MTDFDTTPGVIGAGGPRPAAAAGSRPVVLFDLDGTLINTKRLYLECYRRAILPYLGRELSTEEIMAFRPRSEFRFFRDVVGPERFEACLADFHREYETLHPEYFRGIYAGVPEMLETFRARGHTLGIVTGKSRRSWELTTVRARLGHFAALVFDDDVREPKPDPEGLHLALSQLDADPAHTYYLGDSVSDIEAAHAAGIRPAGALWAKKPADRESFRARVAEFEVPVFETPWEFVAEVL
jgi:phosphoglycolate phosphatase/pyrophosphatase PpaX